MPSLNRQGGQNRRINWPGIVGTLLAQVLVLVALSIAAVYYVNWSSEAALAEFLGAIKPSASDHSRQFSNPIKPVKGRTSCARGA
jgi:hypothetical protein